MAPCCSRATAGASGCSASPTTTPSAVADALRSDALAGMFCAGEIGPVGDRSFVHGFTASVVLFHDRLGPW